MDASGISISEACAKKAEQGEGYLTDEDFSKQCNPDGTVKQSNSSTTFTVKDTDYSVTVSNSHLLISAITFVIVAVIAIVLIIRRQQK